MPGPKYAVTAAEGDDFPAQQCNVLHGASGLHARLGHLHPYYYIIEKAMNGVPHPMRLHDFYILVQGTGTYNSPALGSVTNPLRRDVASFPGSGCLVIHLRRTDYGFG